MKKLLIFVITLLSFLGCSQSNGQVEIELAFPNLSFDQPVDIQNPGDGTNRLFVVSQPGTIYVFENNREASSANVFLDIKEKVLFGGEQGLLGLAFHPDFQDNGFFYVNYTTNNPRRTVVSSFKVDTNDPNKADKNSELVLLEVSQPFSNHNGGQLLFGPDGYLYISLGDGGSGGDPQNYAQNLRSHLGKILRIDVNTSGDGLNYSIPETNPFKGNTNQLKEELYAWGLRNVWRFSFDSETGKLWAADVGQNAWEEINIIEIGKNYGWRIMEGFHCFNPQTNCDTTNLTMPIWEYGHNPQGGYSVTGGIVYRGKNVKELYGKYIYGDFVTGNIWALEYDRPKVENNLISASSYAVSTFGVDENNELYFANYNNGRLYKFKGTVSTGMKSESLPYNFELFQNYPNPFNPETRINYTILKPAHTKLHIYDPLGKKVTTLIDKVLTPGSYSSIIDTDYYNLTSGVYFYKLISGNQSEIKKMVVAK